MTDNNTQQINRVSGASGVRPGGARFKEWRKFCVEYKGYRILSDTVLIFVTYNLSKDAVELLKYIHVNNPEINVIVVDNKSDDSHFKFLAEYASVMDNVRIIQTSNNIGGGGGFAVAVEAALEDNFRNIVITEDDACPKGPDVLNDILIHRNKSRRVRTFFLNNETTSFSFHFHLYPRELLLVAGSPNPNLFQIHDDLEFDWRIVDAERSLGLLPPIDVGAGYFHPIIKSSVPRTFLVYLTCRNYLWASFRHGRYRTHALVNCISWFFFAGAYFCLERSSFPLRAANRAVFDFAWADPDIAQSVDRIRMFSPQMEFRHVTNSLREFLRLKAPIAALDLSGTHVLTSRKIGLQYRNNLHPILKGIKSLFSAKPVVIAGLCSPLHPFALASSVLINVESIDCFTDEASFSVLSNNRKFGTSIIAILGGAIGLANFILILPLLAGGILRLRRKYS
jgi:hypothetical protein